ncbi:hypothetical protein COCMIDRAFT_40870 [Bipolaris oryzae ATCC 44560]|uniref:Uncharacterized protein n=1 Tax=Bipolaris oryzae ATCC 44560 TaxID=930090 RepID=W6ZAW4_COCMI|nr:uncharacterized protein COCMIDRAFT_40870 [Bipolaris oryzae ATCC 44560]EUC40866.1 hypothetical protein COCMIDRAFT_40870 [Bipolaris oryzae ATCC 44560]
MTGALLAIIGNGIVALLDFGQRLKGYLEHQPGFLGQSIPLVVPFVGDILVAGMTHCRISIMYEWTVQSMNFACIGLCASASAIGQHFFEFFEYFDHPSWIGLPRHAVISAQVVASTSWKDYILDFGWSGEDITLYKG